MSHVVTYTWGPAFHTLCMVTPHHSGVLPPSSQRDTKRAANNPWGPGGPPVSLVGSSPPVSGRTERFTSAVNWVKVWSIASCVRTCCGWSGDKGLPALINNYLFNDYLPGAYCGEPVQKLDRLWPRSKVRPLTSETSLPGCSRGVGPFSSRGFKARSFCPQPANAAFPLGTRVHQREEPRKTLSDLRSGSSEKKKGRSRFLTAVSGDNVDSFPSVLRALAVW